MDLVYFYIISNINYIYITTVYRSYWAKGIIVVVRTVVVIQVVVVQVTTGVNVATVPAIVRTTVIVEFTGCKPIRVSPNQLSP